MRLNNQNNDAYLSSDRLFFRALIDDCVHIELKIKKIEEKEDKKKRTLTTFVSHSRK